MSNPTTGLGEDFLNSRQVLYSFVTFKISAFRFPLFSIPHQQCLIVWSVCLMLGVQTVYGVLLLYLCLICLIC